MRPPIRPTSGDPLPPPLPYIVVAGEKGPTLLYRFPVTIAPEIVVEIGRAIARFMRNRSGAPP